MRRMAVASTCAALWRNRSMSVIWRSEEHTSELQSRSDLVCRLLLEKKKKYYTAHRGHPENQQIIDCRRFHPLRESESETRHLLMTSHARRLHRRGDRPCRMRCAARD